MATILINTFGTRGDIQPFLALAQGLNRAGHDTTLCTSEGYRGFVEQHGIQFSPMDNTLLELSEAILRDVNGFSGGVKIMRQMTPAMRLCMQDEWQAAQQVRPDLIIYHPKCLGSFHIAEKLQIPAILSLPLPFYTPTRAFPVPFFPDFGLGGAFNRMTYRFMALSNLMYMGVINDLRQKSLGLPRLSRFADILVRADGSRVPVLYPYSPHVVPVPADFPPHVHVTGYWFLPRNRNWQPQPKLEQFLKDGSQPVYIGFGSIGARGGDERARIVLDALARSDQRGILASGWGGLRAGELPDYAFMVESVPHDWLFERVAAVVHHGGAGTTAAGLAAGKPTLICPFMADQPFWGRMVHQLGAGPKPIPQGRLDAEKLSAGIATAVNDREIAARAAQLGQKILAEDGVARATEIIDSILANQQIVRAS